MGHEPTGAFQWGNRFRWRRGRSGLQSRQIDSIVQIEKDTDNTAEADRPGAGGVDQLEVGQVDLDSMAWLMYSSGTTGSPKGIVHTHRSVNKLISLYRLTNFPFR